MLRFICASLYPAIKASDPDPYDAIRSGLN